MTIDNKQLGKIGEDLACEYLKKQGFRILERNYIKEWDDKTKGEIDIVAKKDGVVCFVEVKTSLAGNPYFSPEERVNYKKQRQLAKLAQTWLGKNKISPDTPWQIDVVSVLYGEKPEICYFGNVVSEG